MRSDNANMPAKANCSHPIPELKRTALTGLSTFRQTQLSLMLTYQMKFNALFNYVEQTLTNVWPQYLLA